MFFVRLCTALLVLDLAATVAASGVGVHMQIMSRVRSHFDQPSISLSTFALPGAFFPDAFYDCMGLSEEAEEAHWPPFLRAAAEYYHTTYVVTDRLSEGSGLRAFLLGALTHQIADVSWHSLGVDQGLLATMTAREFDGDYSSAHSVLDTGADMIFMTRLKRSTNDLRWLLQRWSIPSADLIQIYASLGSNVSRPALEYCMARGVAAISAEVGIAPAMYSRYAQKSRILLDGLESYFLGGLQEITSSITKCLPIFQSWLTNGPPSAEHDAWALCPIFAGRAGSSDDRETLDVHSTLIADLGSTVEMFLTNITTTQSGNYTYIDFPKLIADEDEAEDSPLSVRELQTVFSSQIKSAVTLSTGMINSLFGSAFAVGEFRGESIGPCIAISAPFEFEEETNSNVGAIYVIPISDIESMFSPLTGILDISKHRIRVPPADNHTTKSAALSSFTLPRQFGASMTALNLFNTSLLAVSSPGVSTIDIFAGSVRLLTILPPEEGLSGGYGTRGRKSFGTQLFVRDLDFDGSLDLIVCAPQSDLSQSRLAQGEIIVLSGREMQSVLGQGVSTVAMDVIRLSRLIKPEEEFLQREAGVQRNDMTDYELFGSSIAFTKQTTQSRGVTFIGSEGSNGVFAFNSTTGVPLYALTAQLGTSTASAGFGAHLLLTGHIDGIGDWLLVGSPNESLFDKSKSPRRGKHAPNEFAQTGVLYLYVIWESDNAATAPKLAAYIVAHDSEDGGYNKFGYTGSKIIEVSGEAVRDAHLSNIVFISSPFAQEGKGAVWKLHVDDIIMAAVDWQGGGPIDVTRVSSNQMTPIIRVKPPIITGTKSNSQVESWFGKTVLAIAMGVPTEEADAQGYIFVGMPYLSIGDMGNNLEAGRTQISGGVGVYMVSF
ncbi:zinc dependent phospholipase C-domain-containing protein [Lipomyces oligophaga]|uniref:zinc dependent phospholipase C-domain-containing protein n=1 Tax=Lipomyces oligophaga TaxID=45792 RepID=UPI0034CF1B43